MNEEPIGKCSALDCSTCGKCDSNADHSTITLTLEDDTEVVCTILTVYPVGSQEYIALLPKDENGFNLNEVYLYQFSRTETGDPILANIYDDDEYDAAAREFDRILDNARKAEMEGAPLE